MGILAATLPYIILIVGLVGVIVFYAMYRRSQM